MNNSAIGRSWEEVQAEIFTPEEIRESRLRVAIIGELIKARQERGISQKQLEELSLISSGVKISACTSSQLLPIALLFMSNRPSLLNPQAHV